MLDWCRGEGRVGDLATPLVGTTTVAVQMLHVEDVLGSRMDGLGPAEEEALNERAGENGVVFSLRGLLNLNADRQVEVPPS